MSELKLSPPWNTFVNELKLLFGEDTDIRINYIEGSNEVLLYVDNPEKAYALTQILPNQRIYGNVCLNITVIPANNLNEATEDLFRKAFKGNPVLSNVLTVPSPYGSMNYALFRKQVVQFYNDELCDPHGNKSTLFEEIARDVFGEESGIFFCTDTDTPF